MRYRPYLQPAVPQPAPTGRYPRTARLQRQAERPGLWRTDDAFDPRVVSVVVGLDGCAHAGADVRGPVRF